MNDQVLSIEQMRHLQELGVDTSKASMGWTYVQSKAYPTMKTDASLIIGVDADKMMEDSEYETVLIPTFTLQDIIELLPAEIGRFELTINKEVVGYMDLSTVVKDCDVLFGTSANHSGLINSAYEVLCWITENGYLKGGEK